MQVQLMSVVNLNELSHTWHDSLFPSEADAEMLFDGCKQVVLMGFCNYFYVTLFSHVLNSVKNE